MITREFDFKDKDGDLYRLTVKEEFFYACPNPEKVDRMDLDNKYHINQYLHNLNGPAMINLTKKKCAFWLDGKKYTKEDWEQLAHRTKFAGKIEDIIKE